METAPNEPTRVEIPHGERGGEPAASQPGSRGPGPAIVNANYTGDRPIPRHKDDPRRDALEERAAKLRVECEKHYARMWRAFNKLEKTRRALALVVKRLDALDATPADTEG